jgi:hypothetical protein
MVFNAVGGATISSMDFRDAADPASPSDLDLRRKPASPSW